MTYCRSTALTCHLIRHLFQGCFKAIVGEEASYFPATESESGAHGHDPAHEEPYLMQLPGSQQPGGSTLPAQQPRPALATRPLPHPAARRHSSRRGDSTRPDSYCAAAGPFLKPADLDRRYCRHVLWQSHTQTAIAETMELSVSRVSRLISVLEAKGKA